MLRLCAVALPLALAAVSAIPVVRARPVQGAPPTAEALYAAYADGDYQIVQRTLRNRQAFSALRGSLLTLAGDWVAKSKLTWWTARVRQLSAVAGSVGQSDTTALESWRQFWTPQHVAFLLDVGLVACEEQYPEPAQFLDAAREIVMNRPDPPGLKPAEDAFEITFHRAVLAALGGLRQSTTAFDYLEAIDKRVFPARAMDGRPRLVDLRLVLIRGMLLEFPTKDAPMVPGRPGMPAAIKDVSGLRKPLSEAIAAYAMAAQGDTFAEATVRRAFALYRIGQPAQALETLDRLTGQGGERPVLYWGWLFRGRVLDELGRQENAIGAYREAEKLFPSAQTPKIALASALLRSGAREEAWRVAAAARTTPDRPVDPWWQYSFGDLRKLPDWLPLLRDARR